MGRLAARIAPWARLGPLDGVRGLALICVVWTHLYYVGWPLGYLALETFFAMSGFLITRNLIARPRLGAFFAGRVQRLAPAVFFLVGALFLLRGLIPEVSRPPSLVWLMSLVNLTGWFTFLGHGDTGVFGHLWSLSVEESYYVLWPLLLLPLLRARRGTLIGGLVVLGSLDYLAGALRYTGHGREAMLDVVYFGPPFRAGGILWGCALALSMSWRNEHAARWRRRLADVPGLPFALVATAAAVDADRGFDTHSFAASLPLVAISTLVVVVRATTPGARRGLTLRLLDLPVLRILGLASYSLYLWHLPAIHMTAPLRDDLDGVSYLALVCTGMLAPGGLSFFLLERPYLLRLHGHLRERSAPEHLRSAAEG